ncbi:carboxymuconolactone decarboxylase family protein [Brachybacterium saurashtrense]|uniref:Carboxymuconolactone decarboxylase family protein n=1 Tax=Brachybacterium saurashtrense TaxID=556288 RepID=A0A345YTA2_9MICO|nr:carboxymuconolactone decarboxylase family protein [Brachybacterium saurashtrense]AXK47154.1 carboxymuconolactone decarboxylase family protein [Brachybacterium saurashtrense]RRR20746.1 carboxymuconolactone decarboxylase family protein [Brachybacterium saurashtrense]
MSRIALVDQATAAGPAAEQLTATKSVMGGVPNTAKAMANSPSTLKAYLAMSTALAKGALKAATRERISLAIAEFNDCQYCRSAHVSIAGRVTKLSPTEIDAARRGTSQDPREAAILGLAVDVARQRGHVDEAALLNARTAGVSDEEIVEIIANVVLSTFTNYINEALDVDLDWPAAAPLETSTPR